MTCNKQASVVGNIVCYCHTGIPRKGTAAFVIHRLGILYAHAYGQTFTPCLNLTIPQFHVMGYSCLVITKQMPRSTRYYTTEILYNGHSNTYCTR